MSIARNDIALCMAMVVSLVLLHVMGEHGLAGGLFAVPPMALPFFFALPLCQAFLRGIASARDSMRDTTGESPGTVCRNELRPRFRIWLVLWGVYFVILEGYLYKVVGGGNLIVSVPCATMVLLMVTSCFIWSPRCTKLWPLVLLTSLTPPIAFLLAYIPAFAFVYLFGPRGYMDLGLVTIPPLIASLFLVVAVIVTWIRTRRKGNAWFRE